MRHTVRGGWYCTECGTVVTRLPAGLVTCQRCGALGLVGFDGDAPPPLKAREGDTK